MKEKSFDIWIDKSYIGEKNIHSKKTDKLEFTKFKNICSSQDTFMDMNGKLQTGRVYC